MKRLLLGFLLPILWACGSLPLARATLTRAESTPTEATAGCISSKPTPDDITRAQSFAAKVLDLAQWVRSDHESEGRVAVTWSNDVQSALVYVEALIFPCGYSEADLDHYFSDANWKTIFLDYESYQLQTHCQAAGVRLYEFNAHNQGYDYRIRFWVQRDTDVRVITLMIVFPVASQADFDSYSASLFPSLRSC